MRALIIIKADNIETARLIAQGAPFNVPAETAEGLFVPANEKRTLDGLTITSPATVFWASGEFSEEHFAAMSSQAAGLSWASVDAYDLSTNPTYPQARLAEILSLNNGDWQFAHAST